MKIARIGIVVLAVLVAVWLFFRSYTSPAARECATLYRAARTAADTARIDTTLVKASRRESDPRTCGSLRISARWQ